MALNKQLIPVTFPGGMDQKPAKQTLVPGKFLLLENCIRRKGLQVRKRNGFESLGNTIVGMSSSEINVGRTLATFREELVLFGQDSGHDPIDRVYSYSESQDAWIDRGNAATAKISSNAVIRNSDMQGTSDMATGAGLTVVAWEDSRGGVRASVKDSSNDIDLLYDTVINSTAVHPRVVFLNQHYLILYVVGAALKCTRINIHAPTTLETEMTVIASGVSTNAFDIAKVTSVAVLYSVPTTGNTIQYGYILEEGTLGSGVNGYPAPAVLTKRGGGCISIDIDTVNLYGYIMYYDSTGANADQVRVFALKLDFTSTSDNLVYTAPMGSIVRNMSIRGTDVLAYFDIDPGTGTLDYTVKQVTFAWSGVGAISGLSVTDFLFALGVASKISTIDDIAYIVLAFDSDIQSTYFLVREDGWVMARILPGTAGGTPKSVSSGLTLPRPGIPSAIISDETIRFPAQVKLKFEAADDGTVTSSATGINLITASLVDVSYVSDTLGENLHIAGGTLLNYDGASITEHGFHVYPDEVTASVSAGAGTFPTTGAVPIRVTYEWIDARGQIHRSAPSIQINPEISATTDEIEVTIPRLTITAKSAPRAPVKIVIYSDVPNGSGQVLYKLREITNDDSVEAGVVKTDTRVVYTYDNADGVNLTSREVLYTTGGVLENIAPFASTAIVKHKNRLILVGLEDETAVQFSQEWNFSEGVAFSDLNIIRVDALGGKVTAAASLDDKLILFKKDRMFVVSGDGPTPSGTNNSFSQPELVSADVGTSDPDSVVITPQGLMFKSDKGIYLLSRSLEAQYMGSSVEDYNDLTVSGAITLEKANEIRFTTTDGECLVYNHYFDQWSVFTNYTAESSVFYNGHALHLKASGIVNRETTEYEDNGSRIQMSIESSWLSFAGIQGFQRVYWVHVDGDFLSHHYAKVQLAYDFESVYSETTYYNTVTGQNQGVYGDTSPYGTGVYGGTGASGEWQFRWKPARQRCESVKVRIEDIDTIETNGGPCFNLVAMSFVIGQKTGGNRQSIAKTIGST